MSERLTTNQKTVGSNPCFPVTPILYPFPGKLGIIPQTGKPKAFGN